MPVTRHLDHNLSVLFPALLLTTAPKDPGVAVLCYHDFQLIAKNDMTNTPSNFEAHLKWLKERSYHTISIDQLVNNMQRSTPLPSKSIVLSFDDGYEGVYKYAYPMLKRYGFQGVLFLVTSKMGDQAGDMPHLTWREIAEMDRSNVIRAEVHADKLHIKLGQRIMQEMRAGKKPDDVIQDLSQAKLDIEGHTHRPADFIAWPYGDYNKALIHIASRLGYKAMISTEYGLNRPGQSVQNIKRLRMSSGYDNLKRFEQKLAKYALR